MIRIDKDEIEWEGDVHTIFSEACGVVYTVCDTVTKDMETLTASKALLVIVRAVAKSLIKHGHFIDTEHIAHELLDLGGDDGET